jgi:hypothetical protein
MRLVPLFEGELIYDESTEIGFPTYVRTATGPRTFKARARSAASAWGASSAGRTAPADGPTEPGFRTTKGRSPPPMVLAVVEADVRPSADPEHRRLAAYECVNEIAAG